MKKNITVEDVKKIASLAHINVNDEEAQKYTQQIAAILSYIEKLDEVDTTGIEFKSQTDLKNVFREDIAKNSLKQEDVLKNRKERSKGGSLVISSVL